MKCRLGFVVLMAVSTTLWAASRLPSAHVFAEAATPHTASQTYVLSPTHTASQTHMLPHAREMDQPYAAPQLSAATQPRVAHRLHAVVASKRQLSPTVYFDSPYPGYTLHLKSYGTTVKTVQHQLNVDGYPVGAENGMFGPLVQEHVKAFQAAHHLTADGVVGPLTWGALFPAPTALLAKVQRYVVSRHGSVAVAVYDVVNEETDVFNPYAAYATASIVKPLILATLLHQSELHRTTLSAPERQLATPMIEESNNDDATQLWNLAGMGPGVEAFAHAAGMTDTAPNPQGYWGLTMTTAADQVTLIKDLVLANGLLSASDRNYELNLMHNVIGWQRWGISAGVPDADYVALKNGWLPLKSGDWEINSIGCVQGDGRNYVIAVLTCGNPTEQYGISTIEGIAKIIWDTMPTQAG